MIPPLFLQVKSFLVGCTSSNSSSPYLLALSGGGDSLCLFYALLYVRESSNISFHVAHVDHRWRQESQKEAEILRGLAEEHNVPFHLKILDPSQLKGNLEAACRKERYTFMFELCHQYSFQGLLTGHHQNDQAETIFKRMLEGAHWSNWSALRQQNCVEGVRLLRPLLEVKKVEIQRLLAELKIDSFDDPTNYDPQFLRARLRHSLFPILESSFGKKIESNLILIGKEAEELNAYFDSRLSPIYSQSIKGSMGVYMDLCPWLPLHGLEIKFILKRECQKAHFFLSREILEQAALALQSGKANLLFEMGKHRVGVDRHRIFIMDDIVGKKNNGEEMIVPLLEGECQIGSWKISVSQEVYSSNKSCTSWKEGWKGELTCFLPINENQMNIYFGKKCEKFNNISKIKKRWNQLKVPAFLYSSFPLIIKGKEIYHEFLSGNLTQTLQIGQLCWRIRLLA